MSNSTSKFTLKFHKDGKYNWQTIPEELCKLMCEVTDYGPRYSNDSRYIYSFNGFGELQGIRFGTAKGCVQGFIVSKNKEWENFDVIKS